MCSFYKATPAIIDNDEEQQLLLTFGIDGYWLGTSDIVDEGKFENIDGTEFDRLLFQDGEPDNMDGLEDCAILESVGSGEDKRLHVGDTQCNKRRQGVLCEKSKEMQGNSCPVGFIRWREQCYKRVFAPANWEQANQACLDIGSKLSVPDNEDEMVSFPTIFFLFAYHKSSKLDSNHETRTILLTKFAMLIFFHFQQNLIA